MEERRKSIEMEKKGGEIDGRGAVQRKRERERERERGRGDGRKGKKMGRGALS